MADSMDSILNPPKEQEEAAAVEQEETAVETAAEVETEQETGAAETQVAAETKEEPATDAKGIAAGIVAERQKRQKAEAELARVLAEQEAAAKEEKPYLGEEYEQRLAEDKAEIQEALVQQKIAMSQDMAADKWDDYAEKEADFIEMAKGNPALVQRMRDSANPASFVYKHVTEAQKLTKLQELGDPDEWKATEREKLRAEIKAEEAAAKAAEVEAAIKAKLPRTGFSETRSVGNERTSTKKFDGPTPMKSILG